jgi:hypothetical protein
MNIVYNSGSSRARRHHLPSAVFFLYGEPNRQRKAHGLRWRDVSLPCHALRSSFFAPLLPPLPFLYISQFATTRPPSPTHPEFVPRRSPAITASRFGRSSCLGPTPAVITSLLTSSRGHKTRVEIRPGGSHEQESWNNGFMVLTKL